MFPNLDAVLAPELPAIGPQLNNRNADSDGEHTISTKVVPYGAVPLKSLFPRVGDSLLHYKLVSELGVGAFSRVFLASQQDLAGRLVALKVSECADGEPGSREADAESARPRLARAPLEARPEDPRELLRRLPMT